MGTRPTIQADTERKQLVKKESDADPKFMNPLSVSDYNEDPDPEISGNMSSLLKVPHHEC